jgi:hypothetical protein
MTILGRSPGISRDDQSGAEPIDKHVGSRVRMRRMLIGMSQERLGEALFLAIKDAAVRR